GAVDVQGRGAQGGTGPPGQITVGPGPVDHLVVERTGVGSPTGQPQAIGLVEELVDARAKGHRANGRFACQGRISWTACACSSCLASSQSPVQYTTISTMASSTTSARIISRQYQFWPSCSQRSSNSTANPVSVWLIRSTRTCPGKGWPLARTAIASSAVSACNRQWGNERSRNTSGANSPWGTLPVSRNSISRATATLVSTAAVVIAGPRRQPGCPGRRPWSSRAHRSG